MIIKIIVDVHGKHLDYYRIVKDADASIQVGDLGFNYKVLDYLDHNKHIVIPGNHDNYDLVEDYEHILDGYGNYHHYGLDFFFVRGGFSIDWGYRQQRELLGDPKSWWKEEELSYSQLQNAIDLYTVEKPDIVVSHECPRSIVKHITDGRVLKSFGYNPETFTTRTSEALDRMFEIHQPKQWFFGHYHRSLDKTINGTRFHCLKELEVYDYEVDV
jgi:hypothetical protein